MDQRHTRGVAGNMPLDFGYQFLSSQNKSNHCRSTRSGKRAAKRAIRPDDTPNRTFSCRSIMTLSEFNTKRCEKLVVQFIEKRRPPPRIRSQVDLAFRINGQSVEIFEVRP